GIIELEDLQTFIRDRCHAEDAYASRLSELSRRRGRLPESNPSLLSQIYRSLKHEMSNIAQAHRDFAEHLAAVSTTVGAFLEDNRRLSSARRELIDANTRAVDRGRRGLDHARREAELKWNVAVVEERKHELDTAAVASADVATRAADATEDPLPPMEVLLVFGDLAFTPHEFNTLLSQMQLHLPIQEVKSLLGTYKGCVGSSDMVAFLQAQLGKPEPSIIDFCTDLVHHGFLKLVAGGMGAVSSSASHPSSSSAAPAATASAAATVSFAHGQTYQWRKTEVENEPSHQRARREAERAELEYRRAASAAEDLRVVLEAQCVEYMKAVEAVQHQRLSVAKESLLEYVAGERAHLPPTLASCAHVDIFLETLDPRREVRLMAEKDRSGNARLPPIVYSPARPTDVAFSLSGVASVEWRRASTAAAAAVAAGDERGQAATTPLGSADAAPADQAAAATASAAASVGVLVGQRRLTARTSSVTKATAPLGSAAASSSATSASVAAAVAAAAADLSASAATAQAFGVPLEDAAAAAASVPNSRRASAASASPTTAVPALDASSGSPGVPLFLLRALKASRAAARRTARGDGRDTSAAPELASVADASDWRDAELAL
ncbi:hypothetical protein HK405_012405, partial [Cladochytrium tenue]